MSAVTRARWVLAASALSILAADSAVIARREATPALPISVAVEKHLLTETTAQADKRAKARDEALQALFDRRAKAVRDHDRAAFLRDVDTTDKEFAARQAEVFGSLGKLGFGAWTYEVVEDESYSPGSIDWKRYLGADDVWLPVLRLRYQLAGFDKRPVVRRVVYTVVRHGKRWSIANDRDLEDITSTGTDVRQDPWENGPIVVARTQHALVIGHPDDASSIDGIQREAENAVRHVSSIVRGALWNQRVVVILPGSHDELETELGFPDVPFEFAAVAQPEFTGDGLGLFSGSRVVINPDNFRPSSSFNRRLIRHEITHVALFERTGPLSPKWLVEGIAEYVGNEGAGLSVPTLAPALADLVDAKGVPNYLPVDSDFGVLDDAGVGYNSGWLLCRYIAARYGRRALFDLYDEMGTRSGLATPGTKLDDALRTVLHTNADALLKAWRPYVRASVGDLTELLVAPGKGYSEEDLGGVSAGDIAEQVDVSEAAIEKARFERAAQGIWFSGDEKDPGRLVISSVIVGPDEAAARSMAALLAKPYTSYDSGTAIPHGRLYVVSVTIGKRRYNEAIAIVTAANVTLEVRAAVPVFGDPSGEARRVAAALYAKASAG